MSIFAVGYSAGYYGYMWSLVFAQDMFDSRFAVEGVLNPSTGMDYRNMILGPGQSETHCLFVSQPKCGKFHTFFYPS